MVQLLKNNTEVHTEMGLVVHDIRRLASDVDKSIFHTDRTGNMVEHGIAK